MFLMCHVFFVNIILLSALLLTKKDDSSFIRTADVAQRRPFPTPNQTMLNKFARTIETNNVKEATTFIQSNPCFLISICDTPTILKISTRSNAAHLCAQSNSAEILKRIINCVSSPEYVKRLYPQDSDTQIDIRCDRLLDLYLNSADRMRNDLPLHIACRRGNIEVIRILIAFPGCRRDWLNNAGQTPQQVIDPNGANGHSFEQIDEALNGFIFVPVIEKEENGPGFVCEPCDSSLLLSPGQSPVRAIAGPMTMKKADRLINEYRSQRKLSLSARKSDDDLLCNLSKGPETILRRITKKLDVKFGEQWPFLTGLIDITSDEGLRLLDFYLRQRYLWDNFRQYCHVFEIVNTDKLSSEFQSIIEYCLSGQNNLLNEQVRDAITCICACDSTCELLFKNTQMNTTKNDQSLEELSEQLVKLSLNSSFVKGDNFNLSSSFLNGDGLSQLDRDVFKALQHTNVDEQRYPFVHMWKSFIIGTM